MTEPTTEAGPLERGVVPCRTCQKPHDCYGGSFMRSWADPTDGHSYYRMDAEDAMAWAAAAERERIRAKLEGLPPNRRLTPAAVLAAIEREP